MSAGRAIFRCSDDGRGLDQAAILKAAQRRGLWAQGGPLSPEAAADLVLGGGLSTAKELTELAGRGLGMDVLREGMGRLKGKLEMKSQPGPGPRALPGRAGSPCRRTRCWEVEAGGLAALLPFAAVRSAHLLERREFRARAEGEALLPDGQVLPLLRLDGCFGPERGRPRFAVLLGSGSGQAALGVDRILGVREAVMLPLPDLSPANVELTPGVRLDAAGEPCLLLDPESLVKAARLYQAPAQSPRAASRLPLLVVDDSLTTRVLEQSILESAGYAVDVAASAEEGLAKLRQRRYGVLLVDVEMPGMSGFELLELMQGELGLRDIPAILVTSCATPEDKQRGRAAGAKDYIVKGEFDQSRLLSRIGALLA